MIARLRRVPLWARSVVIALAIAFALGRTLAFQPPGQFTAAILRTTTMTCPTALPISREIRIVDGARTLDRLTMAKFLEAIDGRDRCGRNVPVG